MRVMKLSLAMLAIVVLLAGACGDSSGPNSPGTAGSSGGSSAGRGGTTGAAGTMGAGGTMGNAGTTGSAGAAGAAAGRGGTTGGGGAMGTQPIGAACANTANCSQADGTAVCCLSIPACTLANQCPTSPTYVSCETTPCDKAGWICCNAGGMHFCTKQSGCPTQ